jgi:hypothetical protein
MCAEHETGPVLPKNDYGNVDIRKGVPQGYVHLPGKRLQPLCRKLQIVWGNALVRLVRTRFGFKAILDGVVVHQAAVEVLRHAIKAREIRSSKITHEMRRRNKEVAHNKMKIRFKITVIAYYPGIPFRDLELIVNRACETGSPRLGRHKAIYLDDRVKLAVRSHVRRNYTEHDSILSSAMGCIDIDSQIEKVLEKWREPK